MKGVCLPRGFVEVTSKFSLFFLHIATNAEQGPVLEKYLSTFP
jgi:hypothetical protein